MIHVCFCIHDADGRYSKFTGTAILSMFENSNTPPPSLTVHILHDNTLTQDNRDKFNLVAGRYGQIVKFYNVEKLCADKYRAFFRWFPPLKDHWASVGTLFKLVIADVLSEDIEKIIYIDSDVIVNMNIAELWQIELGEKILGVIPEITNGRDVRTQFALVEDGRVADDDYFNAGVLFMNLKLLRGETQTLADGLKLVSQNPRYQDYMEQDLFNLCFSTRTLRLPTKFNRFVDTALREDGGHCGQKIYHYVEQSETLGLDTENPLKRLWMEYFIKTPWFGTHSIGRIHKKLQALETNIILNMRNLIVTMNGKTRAFFVTEDDLDKARKLFSIRYDEEIFLIKPEDTLKMIYDVIISSRDKKIFFIIFPNFPFEALEQNGLIAGRDFLNAFDFLLDDDFVMKNSYKILKSM